MISSPPSYSSGSERNSVPERSVRIRMPVNASPRTHIIDVLAEELARRIAVEQRRKNLQRHRCGYEEQIGGERTDRALTKFSGNRAIRRKLLVLFYLRPIALRPSSGRLPIRAHP